ncbi:MAG: SLATT domain-containing protein [Bacillota bacterium]|nr:SLATT domain-containing protein [Bacillota bacterium]
MVAMSKKTRGDYTNELTKRELHVFREAVIHEYWEQHFTHANTVLKWTEIILSSITSVAFVTVVFASIPQAAEVIGVVISLILTVVTLAMMNFKYAENAVSHQKAKVNLGEINRRLTTLITDLDDYDDAEAKVKRDALYDRYEVDSKGWPTLPKPSVKATATFNLAVEEHERGQNEKVAKRDKVFEKSMAERQAD